MGGPYSRWARAAKTTQKEWVPVREPSRPRQTHNGRLGSGNKFPRILGGAVFRNQNRDGANPVVPSVGRRCHSTQCHRGVVIRGAGKKKSATKKGTNTRKNGPPWKATREAGWEKRGATHVHSAFERTWDRGRAVPTRKARIILRARANEKNGSDAGERFFRRTAKTRRGTDVAVRQGSLWDWR